MKEVKGNLWTYPADIRVITTNGTVKKDGTCVMGRGCAAEAKALHPSIPRVLGEGLSTIGNHVQHLYGGELGKIILSFPVKHQWFQTADLDLIRQSATELVVWANATNVKTIVLPRPGCGNGHLRWEDVKPILEEILDDRFHVITFG